MDVIFLLAFWLFLLTALTLGWQAGNRHDRRVIIAIAAAAIISAGASLLLQERISLPLVAAVDVLLLVVVMRYALSSGRYWPIWFAAFHMTSVVFTVLAVVLPPIPHMVAERIAGFWSLACLIVMVVGLIIDQRRGVNPSPT